MWAFVAIPPACVAWILQFCGGISPPTTYNTTQSKNDGDLRKFLSIPYKTAQAGKGGNL